MDAVGGWSTGGPGSPATGSAGVALTLLTGPPGIGRSHALRARREAVAGTGRPVLELRLAPEDRDDAGYLTGRILAALAPIPTRLAAGRGHIAANEPPARALSRALRRHPGLAIFIDDAQWADAESAEALQAALPEGLQAQVRCVATLRTGAGGDADTDPPAGFDRLSAAGLVRIEQLRPLPAAELDALVRRLLQAAPHDSLRTELRRLSRGVPGALTAAIDGYLGSAALRIVDRRAYLVDPTIAPRIPAEHDLTRPARRLGPATYAVARALAVLQPLGGAVPVLIGQALGLAPEQVRGHLNALRSAGLTRQGRHGWRIPVPATALALGAGLGPYERRRLAQVAVEALCSGAASCPDPDYLPDQAVIAGSLADRGAATTLLHRHAAEAATRSPMAAARWWDGAAELSGDPADRAEAYLARAAAEFGVGRYGAARSQLRRLFAEHVGILSAAARQEAELLSLDCARGERAVADVRAVADGTAWLPGGPEPSRTTRAAALCVLDRWAEAGQLLPAAQPGPDQSSGPEQSRVTEVIGTQIATVTGLPLERVLGAGLNGASLNGGLAVEDPAAGALRCRATAALARFRLAAVTGDLRAADRELAAAGLTAADLPAPERCLHDWLWGRWDAALDAAYFGIAADLVVARPVAQSTVHRAGAEVLLAHGWPARARAMLDAARTDAAPLPHLLAPVAAEAEWILGDPLAAARIVGDALAGAARQGLIVGTDELWLAATELATERGDLAAAREAATAAAAAAAVLSTDVSALRAATARLIAGSDGARYDEVLPLARAVGQPAELARTIERVVRWTGRSVELLGEAYELFGDLGAVLHRSRVRQAMRELGVAVSGRAETLAEGEQLLAALVAEGLSNRQLAAATQNSEKSVEGRLSRLFGRTGYRSRVELAAAVLVGDYRVG